ncbi:MAG: penicillin acylase family protein [Actinomycetota bacterium]|nr:penicillin acylase family protein [Actinomycetota bacterium]
MKRSLVLALLLLASLGAAVADAREYEAEVRRTSGGVPHIKADSYADLGFGYGHAFAQDQLCTLADTIVTVRAERSRFFGADKGWGETSQINNLKSDFFFQRIKDMKTVERLVAQKPPRGPLPEVRATIRGFVAGYNAYLRRTGVDDLPDSRCRDEPWVRPISEMDMYRRFYMLALRASSVNFLTSFVDAAPPARIQRRRAAPSAAELRARMADDPILGLDPSGLGSNAFGIGRDLTTNGRGAVLGNPHFPWHGHERFYESHLTIPGRLDVSGASLLGAPVINIGTTRGVAWSHTVSTARRFTPYELRLADGDPTSYVVDGETEKMTLRTVRVRTSGSETASHTFYETRWGPVFVNPANFFLWTSQNAYAFADGNADNLRILNVWALMNRAQSVRQLKAAQDRAQGVPWVYTTAADSRGEAYFADHSVVPHVDRAKVEQCVSSDFAKGVLAAANLPVLDGSRSECVWGRDSDALGNRVFGPRKVPLTFRTDYVENSNDSHWMPHPTERLEGFPQIWGAERTIRSLRTRMAFRMMEERRARGDKVSVGEIQKLMFNNRILSAELGRDIVVSECRADPTETLPDGREVDLTEACDVLAAWDLRADLDSRGEILWFEFWDRFSQVPLADRYEAQFDPNDPIGTPHTPRRGTPMRQALADAVRDMRDAGSPLNASVAERQAEVKGDDLIPIHGCQGFQGCFNVIEPFRLAAGDLRDIRTGSSFVMAVQFGSRGPAGRAILTYSQSENPDSPHFDDQTRLYSQKRWLPMRFSERSIRKDPDYRARTVRGSD